MRPPRIPRRLSLQGYPVALRITGIGWYFALCVVLGVVGGLALDGQLGTEPAFTLAGIFAGLIAAFYGGYRQLMDVLADMGKRPEDRK